VDWGKLHIEELHHLYSLPNTLQVIKSRRMRWAGHVAHMGDRRDAKRVKWGNNKQRDYLQELGID